MNNIIPEKLRAKGKTQAWLAKKVKVSRQHLNRIIKNKSIPKINLARNISKAFDCMIEEVFIFDD